MANVKKIEGKTFKANGNEYVVSDMISVERYIQYEKLEPKLTYGLSFEDMFKNLKKGYEALNERRFADASVIIHNMMNGIKDIEDKKRVHPALLMCSLVINRKDEDTGIFDEALALQKIDDWTKEGLNMADFFTLALNSISGFRATLLKFMEEQAKNVLNEQEQ